MPLPLLAGAGLTAWLFRIGSILLSMVCVAAPLWIAMKLWIAVMTEIADALAVILVAVVPAHLTTSMTDVGAVVDLAKVNAIIPLSEALASVKYTLGLFLGVLIIRALVAFGMPLTKLQTVATSYLGWCQKISVAGKA